jgi:epoxyqueuosine reductase
MVDLERHSAMIRTEALRLGFDYCGIASAVPLTEEAGQFRRWLSDGCHGSMKYLETHTDKRENITLLVPGTVSVITVLLNYFTDKKQPDPLAPVLSKYAFGKDYHPLIRKKLSSLLWYMNTAIGKTGGRGFTDSAPIMEKAWAARAGAGWIGKNSILISPHNGSFVFIGILLTDRTLHYDKPLPDRCGSCTRCMDACPVKAIVKPRVVDARRCISYHTIENKTEIPTSYKGKFMNRIFGCDICQDVCPWNRKAKQHIVKELMPLPGLLEYTMEEWYRLSEDDFKVLFSSSPVKRAGYKGIKRNLNFLLPDNRYANKDLN